MTVFHMEAPKVNYTLLYLYEIVHSKKSYLAKGDPIWVVYIIENITGLPCVVLLLMIPESFFHIEKLVFHIMQGMKSTLNFYDHLYTNKLLWSYQKYLYSCFISKMSQTNEDRTKFLAKIRSRSPETRKKSVTFWKCATQI